MRTKIIAGISIIIALLVIIIVIVNLKTDSDKYIGSWKDYQYTYKITKAKDGYYDIFRSDSNIEKPLYFGKYDLKKELLIVHSSTSAGKDMSKEQLFSDNVPDKYPTMYECWIYDEKNDQINVYFKANYDKGNLDLQQKEYILTRVDDK